MRILIVILLLATCAGAVPVDPNAEDGIAAWDRLYVLCISGEVWVWDDTNMYWVQPFEGALNIPLPVDQIADWRYTTFVTHTGDHWRWAGEVVGWILIPPPPCQGSVPSESSSLGGVKSMFR